MNPHDLPDRSRRSFLGSSGALVIGVALPIRTRAQGSPQNPAGTDADARIQINAFVRVDRDSTVTVLSKHIEFGQGPWTGLATLVADELDADWSQVRAEHAPADARLYVNGALGFQGTGGSTTTAVSYTLMRQAGAAARAMLVTAAAHAWQVPREQIGIRKGVISHEGTRKTGTFGEFAQLAATVPVPSNPTLKTPEQFVHIGRDTPKLDTTAKSTGKAQFTLDIYRADMVTVVVERPRRFGATVASVDASAAMRVDGVVDVKSLSSGVAVFAQDTYSALQGRRALRIEWDDTQAEDRSTAQIEQEFLETCRGGHGVTAGKHGDVGAGFALADEVVEAEYTFPYLVHAPMEPLDGVIELGEDGAVDAFMGSQMPTLDQRAIAEVTGNDPSRVRIHTQLAGGSFGRRGQSTSHFAVELAECFMAMDGKRPVKLMWTREDDIRGGYYRPLTAHKLRGGIDGDGNIVAWEQIVTSQSIALGSPFEGMMKDGLDPLMVEGAAESSYALPRLHVSAHIRESAVPVLWWRSVGHSHTAYAVETFLDELLERGDRDPVQGRLALLKDKTPRLAAVLERAAAEADWGRPPAPGHAFGVACVHSFGSYVAQIVDLSIKEDGMPEVHRVWCVVDCGIAVNPNIVKAQMEGGIGFGLGAIMHNALELEEGGAVRQSNFHDYTSLRIAEMPEIEVTVMPSDAPPTGVGEPGVPPIGPAVANAIRRLTGKAARKLPLKRALTAEETA